MFSEEFLLRLLIMVQVLHDGHLVNVPFNKLVLNLRDYVLWLRPIQLSILLLRVDILHCLLPFIPIKVYLLVALKILHVLLLQVFMVKNIALVTNRNYMLHRHRVPRLIHAD